jgi:hypothetical protein
MYHKDSIVKPAKLDWILRYQQDQLIKIMKDNGKYICLIIKNNQLIYYIYY